MAPARTPRRDTGRARCPRAAGTWPSASTRSRTAGVDVEVTIETAPRARRRRRAARCPPRPAEPLRRGRALVQRRPPPPHRAQRRRRSPPAEVSARGARGRPRLHRHHRPQQHRPPARGRSEDGPAAHRGRGGHDARRPRQRVGPRRRARLRRLPRAARRPAHRRPRARGDRPRRAVLHQPSRARPARAAAGSTPSPTASPRIEITNGSHGEMAAGRSRIWDDLLQQGRRIVAVGSSDWHRGPDTRSTWPACASGRAELSTPAILDGIRARPRGGDGGRPHAAAAAGGPGRASERARCGETLPRAARRRPCASTSRCPWRCSAGAWTWSRTARSVASAPARRPRRAVRAPRRSDRLPARPRLRRRRLAAAR